MTVQAMNIYHQKLKEAKTSDTVPRSAVFGTLFENGHEPLSMNELIELTEIYGDRASIYRSVKRLESIGIIRRLHIGWKYKLELSDDFYGHHHHITCISCGLTSATNANEGFEKLLKSLAAQHGYKITDHQLDIKGVCSKCQSIRRNKAPESK